jgi:rhodanese-related sulfurtransferase
MKEDDQLAVFDLLNYEARDGLIEGIPGSVRVDPTRLRHGPRLTIPQGVSVVLYCSSRNDIVSARVAEALRKRGLDNVWVLEGGLAAWIQEGLPVTAELKTPEEVAARLGIVLPARA